MNWNDAYTDGIYKKHWDSSYPSPELVGFISTIENKKNSVLLDIGCGSGKMQYSCQSILNQFMD